MSIRMTTAIGVGAGLALGALVRAQPNLVVNGGFESGPPVVDFLPLPVGSTAIDGWTVTTGPIDYVGPGGWIAAVGERSIDLDGAPGPGAITQTITTTPGAEYRFDWDMAGNPLAGPVQKQLRLLIDEGVLFYRFDVTGRSPTNMGWVHRCVRFTADRAQTTIGFGSGSFPGSLGGPAVDAASVTETPPCYADCTADCVLDIFDYLCFANEYDANWPPACNCDTGTGPNLCDIFDFLCFQNLYAAGCP